MQKVIVGVGVAWLLIIVNCISLVYGQPAALTGAGQTSTMRLGRDLSLTVGLDVWPNQWITTGVGSTVRLNTTTGNFERANNPSTTAFSVGLIPTATLVYQRFFASASYMWTPDYHFGTAENITLDQNFKVLDVSDVKTTARRQEVDFTVGYFPLDWLGVAIGYKGVFQHFDNDTLFELPPPAGGLAKSTFKFNANGVIFGVLGSARIDEHFSLIGNAFGGYLVSSCSTDTTPRPLDPIKGCGSLGNNWYEASKVVLRYAPTPQISMTLGYRVQLISNINADEIRFASGTVQLSGVSGHGLDITHGPVLGVNYRF